MKSFDQAFLIEGLAQEAHRPRLHRSRARFLFRKSSNEDDRRTISVSDQMALQLDSAHTGHLHVGDHARRVINQVRLQKLLGRPETRQRCNQVLLGDLSLPRTRIRHRR